MKKSSVAKAEVDEGRAMSEIALMNKQHVMPRERMGCGERVAERKAICYSDSRCYFQSKCNFCSEQSMKVNWKGNNFLRIRIGGFSWNFFFWFSSKWWNLDGQGANLINFIFATKKLLQRCCEIFLKLKLSTRELLDKNK